MDNFEIRTVFLSFFLYKNKVEWCLNAELMVAMVAIEQGQVYYYDIETNYRQIQ